MKAEEKGTAKEKVDINTQADQMVKGGHSLGQEDPGTETAAQ